MAKTKSFAVLGAVFFLVFFISIFLQWERKGTADVIKDIPAWFQAIGSIGAIFSAWWLSDRARTSEIRQRRQSILAVAEAAYEQAKKICAEANVSADGLPSLSLFQVYDKSIINGTVGALNGVPMHDIGSHDGVIAFLSLRDQLGFFGKAVDAFISGPARDETLADYESDRARMSQLREVGNNVLMKNVRLHFDLIESSFSALRAAFNKVD